MAEERRADGWVVNLGQIRCNEPVLITRKFLNARFCVLTKFNF